MAKPNKYPDKTVQFLVLNFPAQVKTYPKPQMSVIYVTSYDIRSNPRRPSQTCLE